MILEQINNIGSSTKSLLPYIEVLARNGIDARITILKVGEPVERFQMGHSMGKFKETAEFVEIRKAEDTKRALWLLGK